MRATVEPDTGRLANGWALLLDGDLPTDGRPVGGESLTARAWLVGHGAADLDETYLRLVLEGRSSSTVLIRNVRAVILGRQTSISGSRICSPSGGESEIQMIGLNLDDDSPVARELRIDPTYAGQIWPPFGAPYFSKHQVTLVRGEIVTYSILPRSTRDHVEWKLEVELMVDRESQRIVLDYRGQPFRTSPLVGQARKEWDWAWYEGPIPKFVDVTERNRRETATEEESEQTRP